MVVYNNDIGTLFVIAILYSPLYPLIKKKTLIFSILLTFWLCPDPFRWFQTEHIQQHITVNKIFTHDTRESHSYVGWETNGPTIENVHTGSLTIYVSTIQNQLFTLQKDIYPKFMTLVNPNDNILIHAYRFTTFSKTFEIYSFQK